MSESIMCRLCLAEEGNMDYIFSASSSLNFVQKIYECTSLKLQNYNELPNRICEICKSELIIWLKFKRQCINSNTILQTKYENLLTATNESVKLEKYTQTEISNNNENLLFDPTIEEHIDELQQQEQQNFEDDDNDDDNMESEEDIIKDDMKKEKILNKLSENGHELTEYSILEYDQEMNEFIDHTYTEVESTSKTNVFKINMDKIGDGNSIIDEDDNNDNKNIIEPLNKKDNDNKIQIYSLLNINGEDETVEVNQEINDEDDDDNNYNESENIEMLLDSDDNNTIDDIDSYNDDENSNNNSNSKLQEQNINITTENTENQLQDNEYGNVLWPSHNKQKKEIRKKICEKILGISGEVKVMRSYDGKRVSYSYPCTICGQMQTNLKQHMRTHTEELPFKCPYAGCVRAFRQASNLKNHINIHTGEKPYPCQLCEKKFSEPTGLRSHMVLHTRERKYHCNDCGKSFGWSHTLKAHERIHTQDRRHPCSICSKRFLSAHALKKHVRTHTGEKPYECEICGKSFNTSGNLSSHRKRHLREHPFNCHLCTEKFQNLNNLKKHVQKIHKQELNTNKTTTTTAESSVVGNDIVQINDNNDDGYKIEILLAEVTKDD